MSGQSTDNSGAQVFVALLRGVNVGGGNKVPMAELRALAEGFGWGAVRSYIASGNLVFAAPGPADAMAAELRAGMAGQMGVDVPVLVLPGRAVQDALAQCPFDPVEGKHVHGFFLWSPAAIDAALYETLKAPDEELRLIGQVAWLHAPSGIGRSALAEKIGRVIGGTDMTARNLNTLRKLGAMVAETLD